MQPLMCFLCSALIFAVPLFAQAEPSRNCGHSTVGEFSANLAPKASGFLGALKVAVRTEDKRKVAAMVHYPLNVNTDKAHKVIRNSAQFLAGYDQLLTAPIRKAIEKQTAECLFANWQGVMIGDGEVWFEEQSNGGMKIKTLNIP
jgi:hypothetical protein